ncbi:MAG TPA: type I-C CRISPR-associated endonuclease Cas1c, partial [Armatimonadota bacterium]|jgi:CRISPR-associated protein Cas1
MIHQFLNTLYVQSPKAYISLDHDTLQVEIEKTRVLQVPLLHIGAVVMFGNGMMSPHAMQRCTEEGREVTFLDYNGRFRCRVVGPISGNVLLRLAQYEAFRGGTPCTDIARRFVAAKIQSSRHTLLRGARDAKTEERRQRVAGAAADLAVCLSNLQQAPSLDTIRGAEGDASARYFSVLGMLITADSSDFAFVQRTRRPPRDRVNALLSFLYSMLTNDCAAAVEGVGLDPQIGFLHTPRPGRSSLALDLMEEFRSGLVDRLALTLINRRQLRPEHFDIRDEAGGSVLLNEGGRKIVITAFQERKAEQIAHPLLKQAVPLGLVPHLQARLLARHLRGDLDCYQPFRFTR